jgi:hypothetical protein
MSRAIICLLAAISAAQPASSAQSAKDRYVTLVLEERTTLQVGQLALLSVPSDHRYAIDSEGSALVLVHGKRRRNQVVFRAVRPGLETIVVGPVDVPSGDCISCLTLHYFITVISRNAGPSNPRSR